MGIPDSILLKPGPLSEDEWGTMHLHPVFAYQLLSIIPYLEPALDIPHYHHEKWDGSGYPNGLHGEEIPITARIFAIIDVWDALSYDRPYRKAWTEEAVIQYLKEQSGIHFDPIVVSTFITLIKV
jgi:HD-GYP domain-containing protein (c-di-GMP phosphodiesterase class II)